MLDVRTTSCVCVLCHSFVLLFEGAYRFQFWEKCCPAFAELLQDLKNAAGPFSPSVTNLLDVMLCEKDPTTGFHRKSCSYGDCVQCGWIDLNVVDVVEDEEKEKDVFVTFDGFEKVEAKSSVDPNGKAKSQSVLRKQSLSPSAFLRVFRAALESYQKHRSYL